MSQTPLVPLAKRNYRGPSAERLTSALPQDACAIIEREPRSVTQSGPARHRRWRLRFDLRRRNQVDPLTGWTSGTDPLAHLNLRFPDLASAIRFAERQDLSYEVREDPTESRAIGTYPKIDGDKPLQLCCWPTGPHALCCGNYPISSGE
jgi:hypothetical protein